MGGAKGAWDQAQSLPSSQQLPSDASQVSNSSRGFLDMNSGPAVTTSDTVQQPSQTECEYFDPVPQDVESPSLAVPQQKALKVKILCCVSKKIRITVLILKSNTLFEL